MSSGVIDTRAYAAYAVVCVVWGSTYLAIRVGVNELPPALFAGIRFLLAGSLMMAYVYIKKMKVPETLKDIKIIATTGLFLLFGGNGLVVWSEQYLTSGVTALIISTVPLFVAVLDTLFPGGTPMSRKGWLGMLMGFSGVALLVSPGTTGIGEADLPGVAGAVAASFLWAAGSVYSSRNRVTGSMLAISALQTLAAGAALTLTGIAAGELPRLQLTPNGALSMLYLIFFGSILGYSCFVYIIKTMPPSIASTYTYVNPVVAVILGALALQENITLLEIAASVVILGGVVMVQTSRFTPLPPRNEKVEE